MQTRLAPLRPLSPLSIAFAAVHRSPRDRMSVCDDTICTAAPLEGIYGYVVVVVVMARVSGGRKATML